ncbi:FecCD family ABC transporter permease [Clostridium sp.]|uniref:FecCD family ABC transporter permease n=1 Tax=Clostridium sp. TaxID=1506 RepID=UPI003463CCA7
MKKSRVYFLAIFALLLIAIYFSINIGSVKVPFSEIIQGLFSEATGDVGIVRDLRLPRILIAILVGGNLAVSGVLLQAVMKNPLADPGITGISAGASVIAIFVMLYFPKLYFAMPLMSFIGGAFACFLIYSLAWKKGLSPVRIVLAGVAVNSVLGGISGMLSILNSDKISGVLMWLNGNISTRGWNDVYILFIYSLIGIGLALPLYKSCNIILLGDKTAKNLGFNVNIQRILISAVAVFLAGISTSIVGVIGFIGLVVPHISRMLIGSDHKELIPFSAMLGALILLLADTFGRVIAAPYEIPVGIVMAVIGGPFFLYLLRRSDR